MRLYSVTPILRSFVEGKAVEFYVDWLGFTIDWKHRFAPDMPLYMQLSRGDCVLHLSEHHGDATPGSAIRIRVDDVDALLAELQTRPYRNYRPSIEEQPWDSREMAVVDGAGNRLVFFTSGDGGA